MDNSRCNLCGSEKRKFLFKKHEIGIVRCKSCGLVYVHPSISDSKIRKLYVEKDWKPTMGNEVVRSNKIRIRILRMLKSDGNLLDIGCGDGRFLKAASLIYKTTGIDVSSAKVKFGRENLHQNIVEGDIYEVSLSQNHFDIITLIRVIEHLRNVSEALKRINKTMKMGGLLFIKTGNIDGRKACKKGKEWKYIDPPYHLFYFSKKSIKMMLKKNGFKTIKIAPGNLDISRFLGYFATSSRRFLFPFLELVLSVKERLRGNSMMDVYAQKVEEL